MKNTIVFLTMCIGLPGCDLYEELQTQNNFDDYHISIINLITNPERYDGKLVQIVGYVRFEFENQSICLHEEDSFNRISRNCMWLDTDKKECNNMYAIVLGRFDMNNQGHMALFGGTINQVERIWGSHPNSCRN